MFYDISANGNTFLLLSEEKTVPILFQKKINEIADGIIVLKPATTADYNFIIYNKDGTRAHICGNGLLTATFYLCEVLKKSKKEYSFLTDSGYYRTKSLDDSYQVFFPMPRIISANEEFALIDAGNLHEIKIVSAIDPQKMIVEKEVLPPSINLHHVKKEAKGRYSYVSLESGVGFTESCLSGAASIFFYLSSQRIIDDTLILHAPGGDIIIAAEKEFIKLTGKVKLLFRGDLYE